MSLQPLLNVDWQTLPNAPALGVVLCPLRSLKSGSIREFVFDRESGSGQPFRLIAFRHENHVEAFVNQCPHHWLPMNRGDGSFLKWSEHEIMCAHHSAVFNLVEGGNCVLGPCQGSNLIRVPVTVDLQEQVRIGIIP